MLQGGDGACYYAGSWVGSAMLMLCYLRFSGARLKLRELGVLFILQDKIYKSTRLYLLGFLTSLLDHNSNMEPIVFRSTPFWSNFLLGTTFQCNLSPVNPFCPTLFITHKLTTIRGTDCVVGFTTWASPHLPLYTLVPAANSSQPPHWILRSSLAVHSTWSVANLRLKKNTSWYYHSKRCKCWAWQYVVW